MCIYIKEYEGRVIFRLAAFDYFNGEDAFIQKYGSEVSCALKDMYDVMKDMDEWYMDNFDYGCARFEFG